MERVKQVVVKLKQKWYYCDICQSEPIKEKERFEKLYQMSNDTSGEFKKEILKKLSNKNANRQIDEICLDCFEKYKNKKG